MSKESDGGECRYPTINVRSPPPYETLQDSHSLLRFPVLLSLGLSRVRTQPSPTRPSRPGPIPYPTSIFPICPRVPCPWSTPVPSVTRTQTRMCTRRGSPVCPGTFRPIILFFFLVYRGPGVTDDVCRWGRSRSVWRDPTDGPGVSVSRRLIFSLDGRVSSGTGV